MQFIITSACQFYSEAEQPSEAAFLKYVIVPQATPTSVRGPVLDGGWECG